MAGRDSLTTEPWGKPTKGKEILKYRSEVCMLNKKNVTYVLKVPIMGWVFARHFAYIFLLILIITPCDQNYYYYYQYVGEKINV